jgi:dephospho-CoA kinase
VLDADSVVHDLYRQRQVRDAVKARFGPSVTDDSGGVDRSALAARIFADPDQRRWLEGLLHPLVAEAITAWAETERRRRPRPTALIAEVALLFEGGHEGRYDRTLVIRSAPRLRHQRLARRGGLAALDQREALLLDETAKAARADDVIDNDGDRDALDQSVRRYLDGLR